MAKHISTERLVKAGFVLTTCPDGKFWVLEKSPGEEADQIAAFCKKILEDMDSTSVSEDLVLQCGYDFTEPVFYMDGFIWHLPQREFAAIVAYLIKKK